MPQATGTISFSQQPWSQVDSVRPRNSCGHSQIVPELSPAAVRRALSGNTSPLKNPDRRQSHLLFLGPPSPAPGLPAQSPSSCQNLTPRRLPPLFGQQRQRRSPSDCWSPTSKRSESGTKGLYMNQKHSSARQSGLCAGQSLMSGDPSPMYKAGRLLWPLGTELVAIGEGK